MIALLNTKGFIYLLSSTKFVPFEHKVDTNISFLSLDQYPDF